MSIRRFAPLVLLAAGVAGPFVAPQFQSQIAVLWVLVTLALTWDIVGGQMGYNSFGNVVFFGAGMYASAVVQRALFFDAGQFAGSRAAPLPAWSRSSTSAGWGWAWRSGRSSRWLLLRQAKSWKGGCMNA